MPEECLVVTTHDTTLAMTQAALSALLARLGIDTPVDEVFAIGVRVDPYWAKEYKAAHPDMPAEELEHHLDHGIEDDGCHVGQLSIVVKGDRSKWDFGEVLADLLKFEVRDHSH